MSSTAQITRAMLQPISREMVTHTFAVIFIREGIEFGIAHFCTSFSLSLFIDYTYPNENPHRCYHDDPWSPGGIYIYDKTELLNHLAHVPIHLPKLHS